ncbi:hypothetical protein J6590_015891 [Homalodisca vitripennis]|nr:hypothetical protein J6590_015891 [Homalodisca vitripennis]
MNGWEILSRERHLALSPHCPLPRCGRSPLDGPACSVRHLAPGQPPAEVFTTWTRTPLYLEHCIVTLLSRTLATLPAARYHDVDGRR